MFGNLQKNVLQRIKKDQENFGKADGQRLRRENYLVTRLSMLEDLFSSSNKYNEEIIGAGKVEPELAKEDFAEIHQKILEVYIEYRADILDAIDKLPKPVTSVEVSKKDAKTSLPNEDQGMDHRHIELRLPKINLPNFAGSYETWRSFDDLFVSLIHTNPSLTDVQKLHYLKSNVSGEAERLLQHLSIDKGNYKRAWTILVERYDHTRVLVNTQFKLLFGQVAIAKDSAENVKRLLDTSREIIHSLGNLGLPTTHWDAILIFIVAQKLSPTTQQLWEEKLGAKRELPTLKEFFEFLECRFRSLEVLDQQSYVSSKSGQNRSGLQQVYHTQQAHKAKISCRVCQKGQHSLRECKRFLQMEVGRRRQAVYDAKVCENCLAYSHFKQRCPSAKCCYFCKQRHHTLLHDGPHNSEHTHSALPSTLNTPYAPTHRPNTVSQNQQNINNTRYPQTHTYQLSATNPNAPEFQPQVEQQPSTSSHLSSYHVHTNTQVLLATALVTVKTAAGGNLTLRALVDPGSEASFITEAAVQRLNLKTRRTFVEVSGLGKVSSGASHKVVDLSFESLTSDFAGRMRALVFKSLTGLLPAQKINFGKWQHLEGLPLADPTFNLPAKIDLLLGSDIYAEIIIGDVIRSSELSAPVAQKTHLGWILLGKVPCEIERPLHSFLSHVDLDSTLRRFWEVEEEPYEKYQAEEDKVCEEHFLANTRRLPDGRYEVRLPFKNGEYPRMGPSRQGAVKRFLQLEKRLQSNPTLQKEYSKCILEYLELGQMSPVEENYEVLNTPFHYYIPHHAVIKESSTTTKLRVVFDATFKPIFGSSLNDKLMVGPKIQRNVIDIIMRWRKYRYTFTGDVEKMYRQIRISVPDADYQLILWRDDPNQNVKTFRLQTVTFGTASAPYLSIRVLLKLADDEALRFPLATSIIKEETYVDDVITGADSIEEAQQKLKAVSGLLNTAGFHLRKYVSNCEQVLEQVPPDHREANFSVPFEESSDVKTLGIRWLPIPDIFSFQVAQFNDGEVTKRSILSSIARLYDPMGWISPCIIKAKLMMQQLWWRGLDWDQPLPPQVKQEWLVFRDDLPSVERIQIPRWINTTRKVKKMELHGFSDASERAYAAAVYLRVLDENDGVHVHLLFSKTKVAPLATVTLPRLELCGAVLLAKLLHETSRVLGLEMGTIWAWTDSVITLCWIRAPPSRWRTFICNTVSQVQKLTSCKIWRHIPSELNPADLASRGINPSMIVNNTLWWQGPEFLRQNGENAFPEQPSCLDTQQEARATIVHLHCKEESWITEFIQKYSTLSRATRIIAYCLRLLPREKMVKGAHAREVLSPQELESALMRIVRATQKEMFKEEVDGGEKKKECLKGYKGLNPFKDTEGIIRVGGRLLNANLPYHVKHPVVLKANHPLSKLLIKEAHERTLHGGTHKVIAYLRQRFWIFSIKNAVKKAVHDCTICFRFRAKPMKQLMGNLPAARTAISRPFTYSGVDYAGPINVKTWRGHNAKLLKGYFAIFVCMATKAIHIELVSDITTQAFLAAFRRFVAPRGLCRELFSDCGTNFIFANRELKKLLEDAKVDWKNVAEVLANDGTKWKFIPPASPHFGGLWEAGVKSVKFHLKRVAGNQVMTFEELTTLLAQIEACLNSRPLCPQSDDIEDLQPITPSHFLVGEPLSAPPQPDYQLEKIAHLERWKRVQTLAQSFWKEWSSEYLSRLQQRPKWTQVNGSEVKEGDLVLIKDERLPPLKWSLARVIKLHPGPDKLVRVVTLKTGSSELKRPITKICPLPSNTSTADSTLV